jgi:hypothetical protein
MNKLYSVNLELVPTTLDLWHVSLLAAVLALSLLLIIVLFMLVFCIARKAKQPQPEAPAQAPKAPEPVAREPEIKVVEKIVEVEKIVQAPPPEPVILKESTPDAALQLLGVLQKEARFIDFIKEDLTAFNDADIGAAARVVHEGCKKAVDQYFTLATVMNDAEGSRISVPKGFNASEIRLTGNIVGQAPFNGTLVHKGWKVTDIRLPKLTESHNAKIVAAAEVEL